MFKGVSTPVLIGQHSELLCSAHALHLQFMDACDPSSVYAQGLDAAIRNLSETAEKIYQELKARKWQQVY